jgi:hypothetical protein
VDAQGKEPAVFDGFGLSLVDAQGKAGHPLSRGPVPDGREGDSHVGLQLWDGSLRTNLTLSPTG